MAISCGGGGGQGGGTAVPTTPYVLAPTITSQPQSLTVKKGEVATFTVLATGMPAPTYQWRKAGIPLAGATGASLSFSSAQPSDEGSYEVEVANSAGKATSSPVLLTVQYAPVITTQPADLKVSSGSPAIFRVQAEGKPAPIFQWKKNGSALVGATSATYTLPKTVPGDDGYLFTVDAINSLGIATSAPAKLTVDLGSPAAPSIVVQPSDLTVEPGQSATFHVVVTGTEPLTYAWRRPANYYSGSMWNKDNLTLQNVEFSDRVWVEVSNAFGSVKSREAALTVKVQTGTPGINVGNLAADFTGQTWDGKQITLSELRGKVVLFEFAGWTCGPCQTLAPKLEKLYQDHKDKGLVVITILQGGADPNVTATTEEIRRWVETFRLTFPVIDDAGKRISNLYRRNGWPRSYVVGRDGIIRNFIYDAPEYALREAVEAALKQ